MVKNGILFVLSLSGVNRMDFVSLIIQNGSLFVCHFQGGTEVTPICKSSEQNFACLSLSGRNRSGLVSVSLSGRNRSDLVSAIVESENLFVIFREKQK